MMPDETPDVLTVPEVARLLRVSRDAAYNLVRSGSLYGARIGHVLRVPRSEVERLLGIDRGAERALSGGGGGMGDARFMSQRRARTTDVPQRASPPPEPGASGAVRHSLIVRREDHRPVECRICGRRNYAIADGDPRHPIFIVGSTPARELNDLYLCHEHLRELKEQLEGIIRA